MLYGIYLSAAGAEAQSRRLDVLAHNMANVDTPGFKRELAVLEARHAEALEQGHDSPGARSLNDLSGGVRFRESVTDFGLGKLRQTRVPTDLALAGDGFFVLDNEGEKLLTRAGDFRITAAGQLVSSHGHAVVSDEGEPIRIDPNLPWRIHDDGRLEQAGATFQLAVEQPASVRDLERIGENLFATRSRTTAVAPEQRRVRSGYLELSGVQPAMEMMHLIEASRAYEANVRLIQNHDQMLGALVNRVLRQ